MPTLTVSSDSENGALKNGTNELPSITQEATDLSGFGTMGWGFKVTGTGVTNTNYRKAPTKTAPAQIVTTKGNSNSEESGNYSFTLAAKVDNTLAAGTYSGTMTFEATANEATYSISYQKGSVPNESDVTQMPNGQSGEKTPNSTITLSNAEDPDHPKYVFMGWCEGTVTKDSEGIDACNGTTYQKGNKYTLKNDGQNITLIAMWGRKMQNWNECSTLQTSTTTASHEITLVDSRDRKRYYVAKLADNNCWMVENLDFDIDANKTYTSADTDVTTWIPSQSTHKTNDKTWASTGGVTDYGIISPQSYDPGDLCWIGTRSWTNNDTKWPRNDHSSTDLVECNQSANPEHYRVGNYYNYAAAVAQNDTRNVNQDNLGSGVTAEKSSYDTSICPAGWQLPANKGEKSFDNLKTKAQSTAPLVAGYVDNKTEDQTTNNKSTVHEAPYYFTYTGYWRGVSYHFGYYAYYRSSAVSSATNSYALYFDGTGGLYPQSSGGWWLDGLSVRCVAR